MEYKKREADASVELGAHGETRETKPAEELMDTHEKTEQRIEAMASSNDALVNSSDEPKVTESKIALDEAKAAGKEAVEKLEEAVMKTVEAVKSKTEEILHTEPPSPSDNMITCI